MVLSRDCPGWTEEYQEKSQGLQVSEQEFEPITSWIKKQECYRLSQLTRSVIVFCDVAKYSLANIYQSFTLAVEGCLSTRLQGVTSQRTVIFTVPVVRTSNLPRYCNYAEDIYVYNLSHSPPLIFLPLFPSSQSTPALPVSTCPSTCHFISMHINIPTTRHYPFYFRGSCFSSSLPFCHFSGGFSEMNAYNKSAIYIKVGFNQLPDSGIHTLTTPPPKRSALC